MTPTVAPTLSAAATLTRVALELLDVPFEPASPINGERFDHVVESLSTQLSEAAGAELAGRAAPIFVAPCGEDLPARVTRRAASALRTQVEAGRMPGHGSALRQGLTRLASLIGGLSDLLAADPLPWSRTLVVECVRALERLHTIVSTYAHGHDRLTRAATESGVDRSDLSDSAARMERALARCLDRTGDSRQLR